VYETIFWVKRFKFVNYMGLKDLLLMNLPNEMLFGMEHLIFGARRFNFVEMNFLGY